MLFQCLLYSFMQLDLGLLRIKNKAIWHGCPEKDPSAVRLDVLDIEVNSFFQIIRFFLGLLPLILFSLYTGFGNKYGCWN